jgi:23S rRNA (cytidine1920-2'-O)/16S rRNA (cytidine1409-2'-O)-methyltransferase
VRRGLASGRDDAKRLIAAGRVSVAGSALVKAASLVADSAAIQVSTDDIEWASRAGHKLARALQEFDVRVTGTTALDVGASTGGFTDVLLTEGATAVTALDVGYGQLVWRLHEDRRVTVLDRTNFRTFDLATLETPFDVVVVDVSFISVRLLADRLARVGRPGSDYVVLVKPQFEVGKDRVGRGGIVSDPNDHMDAIRGVRDALASHNVMAVGLIGSPITGAKGNREFLLHGVHSGPVAVSDDDIQLVVNS